MKSCQFSCYSLCERWRYCLYFSPFILSTCPHRALGTSRDEQKYIPQCAVHTITPHTHGHLHTHLLTLPPSHLTPSHPHPHTSPLSTSFLLYPSSHLTPSLTPPHTSHPPISLLTAHNTHCIYPLLLLSSYILFNIL